MSEFRKRGKLETIDKSRPPLPAWAVRLIAAGIIFVVLVGLWVRADLRHERNLAEIANLEAEIKAANEEHAMLIDEIEAVREMAADEAKSASETIAAHKSAIASQTATIEALRRDLQRARQATPAPRVVPQSNPVRPTGAGQVSADWIRGIARSEAAVHGLSVADTTWVTEAAVQVAWRESTNRPNARNGQHIGLMQFNNGWGTEATRLCPEWSVRQFVRAFEAGGKANIRRHWAATIGGM